MSYLLKIILSFSLIGAGVFLSQFKSDSFEFSSPDLILKKEILKGDTFGILAGRAGVATGTANKILVSAKKVYDLSLVAAGKELIFVKDNLSGSLKELAYEIDKDEQLVVKNIATSTDEVWEAFREKIEYEAEINQVSGTIESSLYGTI